MHSLDAILRLVSASCSVHDSGVWHLGAACSCRITPERQAGADQGLIDLPALLEPAALTPEVVDDAPANLTIIRSPFRMDRARLTTPSGETVQQVIDRHIPRYFNAIVFLNEKIIPPDERSSTKIKSFDLLVIRALPARGMMGGGGNNNQKFAQMGLMALELTALVVGTAFGAGPFLALGLGLVGNLLVNALIKPPVPKLPQPTTSPASFSISGNQNIVAQDSVFPKIYGTRLIYPLQAADPYNETVGNDQYLRQIFCLGYGPLDITQVSLADSLLVTYEDVDWELRAGYPDDSPISLYTDSVTTDTLQVLLCQAPNNVIQLQGWQKQTTGTGANEIAVDITWPSGFYSVGATNGATLQDTMTIQVQYAPTGTAEPPAGSPGTAGWTLRPGLVVHAGTAAQLLKTIRWVVDPGQYDVMVQVKGVTRYKGVSTNVIYCDTYWTGLRTIRDEAPYAMPGLAMLAVRIRASKQLSGVITNLNAVVSSILRDWDGQSWSDVPGSWTLDYDNTGAGAFKYGLDSSTPHTTSGITSTTWVQNEQIATSTTGTGYSGTLLNAPVQPGSVHIDLGDVSLIDDAIGNFNADGSEINPWNSTQGYAQGAIARYNGSVYVSLQNVNHNNSPTNNTWWAPALSTGCVINYTTGAWTLNLGTALDTNGAGNPIYATYVTQIVTAGAGKALTIMTAAGADGAGVASKNIIVYQDPLDVDWTTGKAVTPTEYLVSGWFKASAAISAGIRLRVYWGQSEDFEVSEALSYNDIVTNGAATTSWQQVSGTVTAPDFNTSGTISGSGNGFANVGFARLVVYHNPDGVGGVTVEWDDISMARTNGAGQKPQLIPNPSFNFPGHATSNPAAHYRDVLQGPANKLAFQVPDSSVDLLGLQAWYEDCATNNRLNNMILDQRQGLYDVLHQIAAIGRASPAMLDYLYSVIQDLPQVTPVQHFTTHNSWGFKSARAFPQLPGMLKVNFINPNKRWQKDQRYVYDDGFSAATINLITEALDLTHGCTDPDQAWREGRYHLAQARLRPEVYQINASVENIVCRRGDLVYVSHDVPNFGLGSGRIVTVAIDGSGNCTGVTTDEKFTMASGSSYVLRIRRSFNGESLLLPINNTNSSTNVLTFTTPIPPTQNQPSPDDLVMFGLNGSETAPLLVTKIQRGKDLNATLYLVDYAATVYTADSGTPPPFDYGGSVGPIPAPPVIVSWRSDSPTLVQMPNGTYETRVIITLQAPAQTTTKSGGLYTSSSNPYIGIDVSFRRSATDGTTREGLPWSNLTIYVIGDTVTYNGTSYIAVQPNTNEEPDSAVDSNGDPYWVTLNQDEPWIEMATQPFGSTVYAQPVSAGVEYDIEIRYRLNNGEVTGWSEIVGHTIEGTQDLANLWAAQNNTGVGVVLRWSTTLPGLYDTYEIRRGATWASASVLGETNGNTYASVDVGNTSLAGQTVTYWVGALNSATGVYGPNPASITFVITGPTINARINWVSTTAYNLNDQVFYNAGGLGETGSGWVCIAPNTGNAPSIGSPYWMALDVIPNQPLAAGAYVVGSNQATLNPDTANIPNGISPFYFLVPVGVTQILVASYAGGGGANPSYGGGAGAYSLESVTVTPGSLILIEVGDGGVWHSSGVGSPGNLSLVETPDTNQHAFANGGQGAQTGAAGNGGAYTTGSFVSGQNGNSGSGSSGGVGPGGSGGNAGANSGGPGKVIITWQ